MKIDNPSTNMSNCLKRNLLFIHFLNESKDVKQINGLLKNITHDQMKAFTEICNHLLCGHCKMDKNDRIMLRKKLPSLKKIASTKYSFKNKKKIINQRGSGFFKNLIPVIFKTILKSKDLIIKHKDLIEKIASVAVLL